MSPSLHPEALRKLQLLRGSGYPGLTDAERVELAEKLASLVAPVAEETLLDFIPRVSPRFIRPTHLAPLGAIFDRIRRRERVRALVSVPAQHFKSTFLTHGIAWLLSHDPMRSIAYATYAQTLADSKSWETRQIAQRAGVALASDRQNLSEWRTTSGGMALWTGIGGPLTGNPAGLVIVDDALKNRAEAESPLICERHAAWYTSVALTRLPEDGSAVVVGTRWTDNDLIGRLEREGDYEVVNLPFLANDGGEFDETGDNVLLPRQQTPNGVWVGWTPEGARAKLVEVGPYDAASIYGGRPRPKGGAVFREPTRYADGPGLEDARIVLAVDPAGSDSPTANHTVAVALAVRGYGDAMTADLVGLMRFRLRAEDAAPRLLRFQRRFGAKLNIEGSRDGKEQGRILALIADGIDVVYVTPVGDKFNRAQPAAAAWNAAPARIRVPARAALIDATEEDLSNFLRVLSRFTGQGDSEDDDADALSHAWNVANIAPPAPRFVREAYLER